MSTNTVPLLWKILTPILFTLGMVLTGLSVFVLLKSNSCTHDCAQKLVKVRLVEQLKIFKLFV